MALSDIAREVRKWRQLVWGNYDPNLGSLDDVPHSDGSGGITWKAASGGGGDATPTITYVTSSNASFTPQADTAEIEFIAVGAGGGGGGLDGQGGGTAGASMGGGGGGVCRRATTTVDPTYNITIGAGGGGGAAGDNPGSAGGATTVVGSVGPGTNMNLSAGGGGGGAGRTGGANQIADTTSGLGGTCTGGQINLDGNPAIRNETISARPPQPDSGFAPGFGGAVVSPNDATGVNASNPGAGGSGVHSVNDATNHAGGDGADGIVIVIEWPGDSASALGGKWERIETRSISAGANEDFTWDETNYLEIKMVIEDLIPATDGASVEIQLGSANGATIYSGATDYVGVLQNLTAVAWQTMSPTDAVLLGNSVGSNAGESLDATIILKNYRSTNTGANVNVESTFVNSSGDEQFRVVHAGLDGINAAVDTIRVQASAGNLEASGTIRLYGLAE